MSAKEKYNDFLVFKEEYDALMELIELAEGVEIPIIPYGA